VPPEAVKAPLPQRTTPVSFANLAFFSGKGDSFHYHADQEELIFVVSGTVEHWIEQEKRILGPGNSVFMPAGVVHATFNVSAEDARVIAILRACVGEMGTEQVDVSGDAPWNGLRTNTT
jgi:quercetin dioxygenase-like cupin family protein